MWGGTLSFKPLTIHNSTFSIQIVDLTRFLTNAFFSVFKKWVKEPQPDYRRGLSLFVCFVRVAIIQLTL